MITPMKKLSILCLDIDRAKTLDRLHDLGVMHVTDKPQADSPDQQQLVSANETFEDCKTALQALEAADPIDDTQDAPKLEDVAAIAKRVNDDVAKLNHLEEQLAALQHEHHLIEPFGNFDPETVKKLEQAGLHVKLFRAANLDELDIPDSISVQVISENTKGIFAAAFSQSPFELDATVFHLPEKSLADLEDGIASTQQQISSIKHELSAMRLNLPLLRQAVSQKASELQFARVQTSMQRHGNIVSLTGFAPADQLPSIESAARDEGWAVSSRDPLPEEDVPTLLRFPKWVKPIKAVMDMLAILPGYRESDISGLFLIFFSIFFAILIGDAGYGLLFLLITVALRFKLPKAPAYPFILFGILSTGTLIWGAITGNWFGIQTAALPGPMQSLQINWLTGANAQDNVITLCFLIGAIHLSIAHIWNTIALAPSLKAIAQVGWIGLVWSMFLTAMNMVLGQAYPGWFLPLFIASVILILLFMTPPAELKADWIQHAMFPLSIVNCFVDIVSYIRLFAVGMASLSVAQSFNDMAMQIGFSNMIIVPVTALILLLGHGLNILLCALGILVHGVRLNTLEFSLHKNIEWKGIPYKPFARNM